MLLYGFVWFGRNSEAEVKTINEWKRLCSREWKRLWSNSEQSVSDQGGYRAARAAKNTDRYAVGSHLSSLSPTSTP